MDRERAGVDVAHRVDEADDPAGSAQVEAGQRGAVTAEVEEGVPGEHPLAALQQPVVEQPLLRGGGMKRVPHIGAPPGRAQARQAQLGTVAIGDRLQRVELGHVVAGDDDRELEVAHARLGQMLHRPQRGGVGAGAAHRVVDLGRGPIKRDLDIEVVISGQEARPRRGDPAAVRGELDADLMRGGVLEQLPEVATHRRLAAADVDVEHLHPLELVHHAPALACGQLARIAPPRARQAVHAGQVAGVGELPGEADRGIQPGLEVIHEPAPGRDGAHRPPASMSMPDRWRVSSARP